MLRDEFRILKRLDEDNIIRVFELLEDDENNESHMIMEYFEGKSVAEFIAETGTFSEMNAKFMLTQLLKAIETLHKTGITHCDIKPENVLINADLHVKLIDFNISRSKCDGEISPNSGDSVSTSFTSCLSSPLYAAPEVKQKSIYSDRVDVWGAGIVLFSVLLGSMKSFSLGKIKDINERTKVLHDIILGSLEISKKSQDFLLLLLASEAKDRPTAREALCSSWLKE